MTNQAPIPFRRKPRSWVMRTIVKLPQWVERLVPKAWKKSLFWLVLLLLIFSFPLVITPVTVWQQTIIATILIIVGFAVVRLEKFQSQRRKSEYLHLFLAWLSIITTLRYLYYRTSYTLNLDTWLNGTFSII
ncbi:MAG: cellulose synthase, partial [Okeania sp. SIO2G5]|nr:cellulose synthase [Okeania sp. SIO2G5]